MARGKKYKPKKSEKQRTAANLATIRGMAEEVRNYKPTKLDVKRKKFKNNTPKRPSIPKLPEINLPGGGLTSTRVSAPSGRPGKTIKNYKPVSDYSNTYKNRTPRRPK